MDAGRPSTPRVLRYGGPIPSRGLVTTSPAPNVAQVALVSANDDSLRTEKPTDTPVAGAAGTARTANVAVSHGCIVNGSWKLSPWFNAPPCKVCSDAAGQME